MMKRFLMSSCNEKILCYLSLHKCNVIDVSSLVHLECRYCNKPFISKDPLDMVEAIVQRTIFKTELKLTRFVMIEKMPTHKIYDSQFE